MRASVYTRYGGPEVLHIEEVPRPAPGPNELLVRVRATAVNFGDLMARDFKSVTPGSFNMPLLFWVFTRLAFGLDRPRRHILGSEFAGEVEAVGSTVTRFKAGDAVFGYLGERMGAYAEYLCAAEDSPIALKPANVTFEEAAAIPYGGVMAMGLLRKMTLARGTKVLINGASGGIGAAAVQIAKHLGASVTGVCGAPRLDFVKALGAERALDYAADDFTRSGETWNVILDVLGRLRFEQCAKALAPEGVLLCASFKARQLLQMAWTAVVGGKKVVCALAPGSLEDLDAVKALVEAGALKAIIDRTFSLDETAEAHRYAASGQRHGQVVITVR